MTDDEVLEQLRQGNESRARASAAFMAAYDGAGTEVARCWAAHMVAVMNDSPQEKLRWNMESLRAAEAAAGDPRAPGLLPTVLANIGYSTLLMAQPARARSWYSRAAVSLGAAGLPDDRRRGYEAGINSMLAIIDAAGTLGLPDPPLDATDSAARAMPLSRLGQGWAQGTDLRFVLLHLINETARHAGHADATRELLDGLTGE